MKCTISLFVENKPGVLYRVSNLFLRRKINIETLTVSQTEKAGISRITLTANINEILAEKLSKELYRIIEVLKVITARDEELIFKEIALFKVAAKNPQRRLEIERLTYLFNAKIIFVGGDYLLIEQAATEEEIDSFLLLLKPFGIKEFVRSGRVALIKKEEKIKGKFLIQKQKPSDIVLSIDVSAIKKLQYLADEIGKKKEVISLAQGVPNFETPQLIKKEAKKAIDQGLVDKYTVGYGIEPLREAIVQKLAKDNKIKAKENQVIVTHGAIEALMATFLAIFNPDDEIIILTPDYASHITQLKIVKHGGIPVFVPLKENNSWTLDPDRLEAAVTQKTKGILFCNPSNPIGKVYSFDELKQIVRVAQKHNLFIITDEIYEYFTFDGKKHISIGSFPEVADRTISIFGVSKSYSMTGWRIGYLVAEEGIARQIFKIHDSLITCPTAVSQYAALAAIKSGSIFPEKFKEEYQRRRDLALAILAKTDKLTVIPPEGSYYLFPKINFPIDDYEFAVKLLEEAGVATVPGSAFGLGGENHLRISLGVEEILLKNGLEKIVKYLNHYKF